MGWQCPSCRRCYAPSVTVCPECVPSYAQITSTVPLPCPGCGKVLCDGSRPSCPMPRRAGSFS